MCLESACTGATAPYTVVFGLRRSRKKAPTSAKIPTAPIAALTPMPAIAPGDKPEDVCDVLEEPFEVEFEVEFKGTPGVAVATFQPLIPSPTMLVEEFIARVF
jgi:hypothetical protein